MVRESKHRSRRPRSNGTLAATSPPDRQPFLLIDALGLLAVDHHALPAQQDVQTTIAEPATLVRQLTQLRSQPGVIVPSGTITHAPPIGINDPARPPYFDFQF